MDIRKKLAVGTGALIAVVVFGAVTLFVLDTNIGQAAPITKLTPEVRLARAEQTLNQLSKKPTDKSTVIVSFAATEKKEFIKELAKNRNVQVERMYHVYKTDTDVFRGGYLKDPSETLDEALAQHEREILEGIEMQVRDLTQQVSEELEFTPVDEKDNGKIDFREGMIKLLPELEHRLVDVRENGLQLFGVMISASNADLMALSKNPKVKLVEVIQSKEEKKAMPLLP